MPDRELTEVAPDASAAAAVSTAACQRVDQLVRLAKSLGIDRLDAEVLVAHGLGRPRAWLRAWPEHNLSTAEGVACEALLRRRAAGEPVAYILGKREFWSLDLRVTPDTLIPRADTETLVEQALRRCRDAERAGASSAVSLLDLGTGSGAIALALKHELPAARVVATDLSAAALRVAAENAGQLGLTVELRHGAWWAATEEREYFDVIVSNPPYIAQSDSHPSLGDLRFEPRNALLSGADGLDALTNIIDGAPRRLKPDAWLLVEHGFDQGASVRDLFRRAGFAEVSTMQDLGGRDRITEGRLPREPIAAGDRTDTP